LTLPFLASALSILVVAQAGSPAATASPSPGTSPTPVAGPILTSPLDEFGPDLKAWLDATKVQDEESASRALKALQRRRAERNLSTVDEVAGILAGRGESRAAEGKAGDAASALAAATLFAPDSAEMARETPGKRSISRPRACSRKGVSGPPSFWASSSSGLCSP
jgi:hypothetical protein